MSRYTDLRDAWNTSIQAGREPDFSVGHELHAELDNAADDMQRLWDATESMADKAGRCFFCGASSEQYAIGIGSYDVIHRDNCPREALRPLFGEVDEL